METLPTADGRGRVLLGGRSYVVGSSLLWMLRGRLAVMTYSGGTSGRVVEERVGGLNDETVLIGRSGPAGVGVLRMMRGLGSSDGEVV